MKIKTIFGIIFIVASLIKLASLLHLIHISWLERVSDIIDDICNRRKNK